MRISVPQNLRRVAQSITGARFNRDTLDWSFPDSSAPELADRGLIDRTHHLAMLYSIRWDAARKIASADPETLDPIITHTPQWPHQRVATHFARALISPNGGALLAMDMGTGKTKVAYDLIRDLSYQRTLVLCPKAVVPSWHRQATIHLGPSHSFLMPRLHEISDPAKRWVSAAAIARASEASMQPVILVTNYEQIGTRHFTTFIEKFAPDFMICDEIHRIKAAGGVRSRFLAAIAQRVRSRLGLTGTPIPNSPMDLYGEFRFLDKGIFGTSAQAFRDKYSVMGGFQGRQIVAWKNKDEMSARMARITYTVRADDVLKLPEAVETRVDVSLTPATMRVYREMEEEMITTVKSLKFNTKDVTASTALVKLLRLAQITGGHTTATDGTSVRVGQEKVDALVELVEEMPADEPFIVFCRFVADMEACKAALRAIGISTAELSGRMNEFESWQAGNQRALIVQIASGGEGVDMTRARRIVYFSIGYSLKDYLQSRARIRRPGQRSSTVYYHHLVATDTVDEDVHAAIERKEEIVESILEKMQWRT